MFLKKRCFKDRQHTFREKPSFKKIDRRKIYYSPFHWLKRRFRAAICVMAREPTLWPTLGSLSKDEGRCLGPGL